MPLASVSPAEIEVERVGPPAVEAGLETGDVLFGWSGSESREGSFDHWWQFELLIYTELARGSVSLDLGPEEASVELASQRYSFKARPRMDPVVGEALLGLLSSEASITPRDVEELIGSFSAPEEIATWSLVRHAETLVKTGKLPEAVEWYQRAVELAPLPFSAELLRRSGVLLSRMRHYEEAEAAFDKGMAIWKAHRPGGLGLSSLVAARGSLYGSRFDLDRAREVTELACEMRRRHAPGSWFLGNCLNNLGVTAARRNDLATAESYFLESLELIRAQGGEGERMLGNLGNVARLRGDFERAEAYTQQSLAIYRQRGIASEVTAKTINLANIVGDSGNFERAITLYGEALRLAEQAGGDAVSVGSVLINRGKVFRLQGDYEAAESDLLRAKKLFDFEAPSSSEETTLVALLGEIALERGQFERAVDLLQTSLGVWSAMRPDSSSEAVTASHLGRAWWGQGDLDKAEASFRRSIEAIEKQQLRAGGGDRGLVAFRSKFSGLYRTYVEFLLEQGRATEAFELYERSRAQALRALLDGRDLVFAVDKTLEQERREIGGRIEVAYRTLSRLPMSDSEGREALRLDLGRLHAERDALSRTLQSASPRIAAAESPPALTFEKIQSAVGAEETLLLAYSLGRESSTLFVVSASGELEAFDLPIGSMELKDEIGRWSELVVSSRSRRELGTVTGRLAEALLSPVQERLADRTRVVIIPDGPLNRLAFGALPMPGDSQRYLVEVVAVSSDVSASIFANRAARDGSPLTNRVAVFADPGESQANTARFRGALGRLPAARTEAREVEEVFEDRAIVYLDELATETAAREELTSAGITHFACHAIVDSKLPLDSALSLSADGDSGLLQAWEIAEQIDVRSDLVVLSACDTAGGGGRSGEGIVGLVRAFQVAGAETVIATLWRIGDESAAALMGRFYRHLVDGLNRTEALQAAQLDLIRGPVEVIREGQAVLLDASSPRHWAPFILLGRAD